MSNFIKKCGRYAKRTIKQVLGIAEPVNPPVKERKDCDYSNRKYVIPILKTEEPEKEVLNGAEPQIAIQVHMFFEELAEEVLQNVNKIPYPFDCYISTDTEEKKSEIEKVFCGTCKAVRTQVEIFENRGRDVAPFLQQMGKRYSQYKYIGHIHTKKSKHTDFGDGWRHFLYRNLLDSEEYLKTVFAAFEKNEKLGMIMPEIYPLIQEFVAWDGAKEGVEQILEELNLSTDLPEIPMFPAGNMFWARTEAVAALLGKTYNPKDYPEENGQLNLTMAHCVERIWVYLLAAQGYDYEVWQNLIDVMPEAGNGSLILCGEKNQEKTIEEQWVEQLRKYEESELKKYEQVLFLRSDFLGPVFSLNIPIAKMKQKVCDYWTISSAVTAIRNQLLLTEVKRNGATVFDLLESNPSYTHIEYIEEMNCIEEMMHVREFDKELPYEMMLFGNPFYHEDYTSYIKENERIRFDKYLKAVSDGSGYKK